MSVGYPVEKSSVDGSVGQLARTIEQWSARVPEFKAWLDTMPDATLEAPPFGYTAEEVALLKSATNDMQSTVDVYVEQYSAFVKRIAGIPAVFV